MGTVPRFIRVHKDNKTKDRGFIAVDAICSVFENKENHNVSIMTMDGFWYDVDEDVDKLYDLITGKEKEQGQVPILPQPQYSKKDYFRHKKMMPAMSENDRPNRNHEDLLKDKGNREIRQQRDEDLDVFRPVIHKSNCRKSYASKHIKHDLPTGVGGGHYDLNPRVETPPQGEGL